MSISPNYYLKVASQLETLARGAGDPSVKINYEELARGCREAAILANRSESAASAELDAMAERMVASKKMKL